MSASTSAQDKVGRGMAIMLLITGAGHFIVPGPVDQLVPAFLPGEPRIWTYLSGVAEVVIALMLLAPLGKRLLENQFGCGAHTVPLRSSSRSFQPISIWRSSGVQGICQNHYLRMCGCFCNLDFSIGHGHWLKI